MDESGLEHLEYKENLNELHSMMYWEAWFRFAVRDNDPDRVRVSVLPVTYTHRCSRQVYSF